MKKTLRNVGKSFTRAYPIMADKKLRRQKGDKIASVLLDAKESKKIEKILDLGCSNCIVLDRVVEHTNPIIAVGVDLDSSVFPVPTENRKAIMCDGEKLCFSNNYFDAIICNHVYEHVTDSSDLFKEMYRVLKPGGIIYFGAMNALWPIEPHYHAPFLHWLPRILTYPVMKLLGHNDFYLERPLTYFGLRKLVRAFDCTDYTRKIIMQPERFHAGDIIPNNRFQWLYSFITTYLFFLLPGYVWVLKKSNHA